MRRMAVLMAVAFVDMIGLMLVLPLLPLYAAHLHASATALCLCNVAFAWKWLPESRVLPSHATSASGRHVPPPEPRPVLHAMWDVIRHPGRPAAQVIWIYAVAMLAYNSAPAVFTLYLSWRFGIDVTNIGWFFTVFGGVGVLMRAFVVGPINDRLGEVRTMRLGAALYGLG